MSQVRFRKGHKMFSLRRLCAKCEHIGHFFIEQTYSSKFCVPTGPVLDAQLENVRVLALKVSTLHWKKRIYPATCKFTLALSVPKT